MLKISKPTATGIHIKFDKGGAESLLRHLFSAASEDLSFQADSSLMQAFGGIRPGSLVILGDSPENNSLVLQGMALVIHTDPESIEYLSAKLNEFIQTGDFFPAEWIDLRVVNQEDEQTLYFIGTSET